MAIDSTTTTAIASGFSGFNTYLDNAISYGDPQFVAMASGLSPGWLRYPAGTESDAFDWTTGLLNPSWVSQFSASSAYNSLVQTGKLLEGRGGATLGDFATMTSAVGAKGIIICINGFTDTPASAGALAQEVVDAGIPVAAWELSNEPYFFSTFFSDGASYATQMKPYGDAITSVIPNAVISVFAEGPTWNASLYSVSQYWNAISYHDYPSGSATSFPDAIADMNEHLVNEATQDVQAALSPNAAGTQVLITEYDPTLSGIANGTLYGGIYVSEYVLRMAQLPGVTHVGEHALSGLNGIDYATSNISTVLAAADAGTTIDTATLSFGYFYSAQAVGLQVANGALIHAQSLDATTVQGGGTSPATDGGTVPAIYAQAMDGDDSNHHLVLTNKGSTSVEVSVTLGGQPVTAPLTETFVTGAADATNTASAPTTVAIQSATVTSPFAVAPYSVVHVAWPK